MFSSCEWEYLQLQFSGRRHLQVYQLLLRSWYITWHLTQLYVMIMITAWLSKFFWSRAGSCSIFPCHACWQRTLILHPDNCSCPWLAKRACLDVRRSSLATGMSQYTMKRSWQFFNVFFSYMLTSNVESSPDNHCFSWSARCGYVKNLLFLDRHAAEHGEAAGIIFDLRKGYSVEDVAQTLTDWGPRGIFFNVTLTHAFILP